MLQPLPLDKQRDLSSLVRAHQPCPDCKSSDALAVYTNGSHCFSCDKTKIDKSSWPVALVPKPRAPGLDQLITEGVFKAVPERGWSKKTCERFGVRILEEALDHPLRTFPAGSIVYPYHTLDGQLVAQKIRLPDEHCEPGNKCVWLGESKKAALFGSHLFKSGDRITLIEGEGDTLSVYEMNGNWPVVSLKNGAGSAEKDIRDNYEYLQTFKETTLCYDNDEAGRIATQKSKELISCYGRVKVFNYGNSVHKDATDFLSNGDGKFFKDSWFRAEEYVPAGVVSGLDVVTRALKKRDEVITSHPYPWKGLNDYLFGIRGGEMIVLGSGTGQGKSSILRELVFNLISTTEDNIGLMFLEESVERTADALCGLALSKPVHLPGAEATQAELKRGYAETSGALDKNGEPRVFFYDHFGSADIDTIISQITYFARAKECKYIILDHISMIVSDQRNLDERQAIDELVTKLRSTVERLGIALFVVSHLKRSNEKGGHEEGAQTHLNDFRGSHSIVQLADVVIGLERNKQDEDEEKKNITRLRVLKNRFAGLEGVCCYLKFERSTFRMKEMTKDAYEKVFGASSGQGKKSTGQDVAALFREFERTDG